MLLRLLTALATTLTIAGSASAASPAGELELVDLTPQFDEVWTRTQALPDSERAAALRSGFAQTLPGFYSVERFRNGSPEKYEQNVLRALKAYPSQRADTQQVSRSFEAMFRAAVPGFEARFGAMRGYEPVYLVNSLGEFDGGTRELGGRTILLFGADMIARYHAGDDLQPFFHHELFHLMHARTFKECDRAWCGLWTEGMAVYVAATLNPKATDSELLLVQPEPIRAAVDANRNAAVCAVVARLDSAADADMQALFSFRRMSPELPPRFGYYVGYLAAVEAGKHHSLDELAKLDNAAVRPLLERSLRSLADCAA